MPSSRQMQLGTAIMLLFLAVLPLVSLINPVSASIERILEVELDPVEDACVRSDEPDSNFGDSSMLLVSFWDYNYVPDIRRNSYLKFDLSSLSKDVNMVYAKLELYCWSVSPAIPQVGVHYCTDDFWSENSITWNNAPSFSSTPTSVTELLDYAKWYTWDITDNVKTALADETLTVALTVENTGKSFSSILDSKENLNHNPKLVIGYATQTFCTVSQSVVTLGNSVTVTGGIPPKHYDSVQLTYTRPDMETETRTVITDSEGDFVDTFMPSIVGDWSVTAAWDGAGEYDASSSTEMFVVTTNERDSWAIVVGVNDYQYINDLDYTDDDAIAVCTKLKQVWLEDHIMLLLNQNATKSNIESTIKDWLAPNITSESTVLFFFSGHGGQCPYDDLPFDEVDYKDEFICPYDSLTYSYTNDILDDTLDAWLDSLDSNHISVFLDSCNSGGFIDKTTGKKLASSGSGEGFARDLSKEGRVIITASAETESSWELAAIQHGIFTYYLLESLNNLGQVDLNGDNSISAEEIFAYIEPLVSTYDAQISQHPQMYDGYAGELTLITTATINFDTNPSGLSITIDEVSYTAPVSFVWPLYTEHTFNVSTQIESYEATRHFFTAWNDANSLASRTILISEFLSTSYIADYQTQHYLTVDSAYGSPDGEGWYDAGITAAFSVDSSVTVSEGTRIRFTSWSGDSSSTNPSATLIMDEPKQVSAGWKTQHYLTIDSDYGNPTGEGWHDADGTASFSVASTVSVDDGERVSFTGWSGDSSSTNPSATLIMDEPKQVSAEWQTQYYLSVDSAYGSPNGDGWYTTGSSASFNVESTVSISEGVKGIFRSWSGDSSSISPSATILMDAPKQVSAEWQTQYYLSVDSVYGRPDGEGWYESGSTASFSAESTVSRGEGERVSFTGWSGDSSSTNPSATLIMDEPKQVSAGWKTQYQLAIVSEYGNPEGEGWYDVGNTASFSATSNVTVSDGTRVLFMGWSGDTSSTSQNVTLVMDEPKQVSVEWQVQHYLTVAADPAGTVALSGEGWYNEGSEALTENAPDTLSGIVGTQYIFETWEVDNVTGGSNSISVVMDCPHVAVACYRTQYYLTVVSQQTPIEGEGWYDKDSVASFSVVSPQGFIIQNVFTGWSSDSTSTSPSATIIMNGPKTVTANWREDYIQVYIIIIVAVAVATAVSGALILKRKSR